MVHVHVRYINNAYDVVNDVALDELIAGNQIKEFYRPSEKRWVVLGTDAVRGIGGAYAGPERRSGIDHVLVQGADTSRMFAQQRT